MGAVQCGGGGGDADCVRLFERNAHRQRLGLTLAQVGVTRAAVESSRIPERVKHRLESLRGIDLGVFDDEFRERKIAPVEPPLDQVRFSSSTTSLTASRSAWTSPGEATKTLTVVCALGMRILYPTRRLRCHRSTVTDLTPWGIVRIAWRLACRGLLRELPCHPNRRLE